MTDLKSRIIVALDVETAAAARSIVAELKGSVGAFKVGLQLFTSVGPEFVRELVGSDINIFLDLKFHDIPNTVAKASVETARLGVWMFNVHVAGGSEMMRQAVREVDEACASENIEPPLIIGVTVLTSSNDETMREIGIGGGTEDQVVRLARLASECGLDGVVASPHETGIVKNAIGRKDFLVVAPGIRATFATGDDQKRVTTLREACALGSDYVVIGRPITQAKDRLAAVEMLIRDDGPAN